MVPKLLIDIETRSRADLPKIGARRYAADPSTQITTAAWKWSHELRVHTACNIKGLEHLAPSTMAQFVEALNAADHIVAHNINFDANVIFSTLGPCGMLLDKFDDTMARAQRMSLPGGLDELCKALGVPGKDPDGHRLVMATCKPGRSGTFNEDPQVFADLLRYNVRDVECLETVDRMLPPLPPEELLIWRRTWRKNAFGLPLDLELCELIAKHRADIERETAAELIELTQGAVTAVTQRARILQWVQSKGVRLENTQRSTLELWLNDEMLPFDVWRVLSIMFESGGSAPTKAQALLDRHVRGYFQDATLYFGARSGRGTSLGVNTFNIARPSGLYEPEEVIARLKSQPNGQFNNTELSDVLRGVVVAPPGYRIIDADLSNIELRLSLWFAGDRQKLEMLGKGADLYAHTAAHALSIPGLTKKTHPKERQAYKKCFGPDTLVLTSSGYKRIVHVSQEDMLWDGLEWVTHQGLLKQGVRRCATIGGISATEDHSILCGTRWISVKELREDRRQWRQALETGAANLSSQAILSALSKAVAAAFLSNAIAVPRSILSTLQTLSQAGQKRVSSALSGEPNRQTARSTVTKKCAPTTNLFGAFTVAWPPSMTVASILAIGTSRTTASEESLSGRIGALAGLHRFQNAFATARGPALEKGGNPCRQGRRLSWLTFSRSQGMMTRILNWTGLTITKAMSRVTFVLLRAGRTCGTGGQSSNFSSNLMDVYDLANCGPRHRFTILSSDGPVIAANCVLSGGYAIGVNRLFLAFKTDKDLPYDYRRGLTYAQVAAIHAGYRDANVPLQNVWKHLDETARAAIRNRGAILPACGGKAHFQWRRDIDVLELTLPDGRKIPHYNPSINENGELVYWRAWRGRMVEGRAFGGAWLEILSQSTARSIIVGVEAAVERELPDVIPILDIYDSIVALAPAAVAEERKEQILGMMRRVPPWAEGLPLDGEGYVADRMQK